LAFSKQRLNSLPMFIFTQTHQHKGSINKIQELQLLEIEGKYRRFFSVFASFSSWPEA